MEQYLSYCDFLYGVADMSTRYGDHRLLEQRYREELSQYYSENGTFQGFTSDLLPGATMLMYSEIEDKEVSEFLRDLEQNSEDSSLVDLDTLVDIVFLVTFKEILEIPFDSVGDILVVYNSRSGYNVRMQDAAQDNEDKIDQFQSQSRDRCEVYQQETERLLEKRDKFANKLKNMKTGKNAGQQKRYETLHL